MEKIIVSVDWYKANQHWDKLNQNEAEIALKSDLEFLNSAVFNAKPLFDTHIFSSGEDMWKKIVKNLIPDPCKEWTKFKGNSHAVVTTAYMLTLVGCQFVAE